jgi:hypothetical protein
MRTREILRKARRDGREAGPAQATFTVQTVEGRTFRVEVTATQEKL